MKKANYRRSALRKTAARLAAVLIAMMFVAAQPLLSFAASGIQEGDTISYSHDGSTSTFGYGDYVGKCIETGIPYQDSGTAIAGSKFSNSTQAAKLAYYYSYVDPKISDTTKPPGLEGIAGDWCDAVGWAISYAYLGPEAWRATASNTWSPGGVETVESCIVNTIIPPTQNVSVPSGFEMWTLETETGFQNFSLWRMAPTGKLKLKKASANTGITG